MTATGKAFELDKLRVHGRHDVFLVLDRTNRVIFPAENERWALDPVEIGQEVVAVLFRVRSREVEQDLRLADGP